MSTDDRIEDQPCSSHEPAVDEGDACCRICLESLPSEDGAPYLCPCSCRQPVHLKCLEAWQTVLRSQGLFRKARQCEVCKSPLDLDAIARCEEQASGQGGAAGARGAWAACRRQLRMACQAAQELFHSHGSIPQLAFRLWRTWVLAAGLYGAVTAGAAGLRAGAKLGRTLVEEQSGAVVHILAALADVLGTPAAEVLWIQLVAGVVFALVSEFLYSALLGAAGGAVYGFCVGYWRAVHGSLQCISRVSSWTAGALFAGTFKLLKVGWAAARRLAPWGLVR